jgi:anti-sigma B factor antagonist
LLAAFIAHASNGPVFRRYPADRTDPWRASLSFVGEKPGGQDTVTAKKRIVLRRGSNIAMDIATKEISGVSVVAFNGRIVLGEESSALREKVKSLLGAGKKRIVLDMSNVAYIDSAGLGILVAAHVSAKKQGAALLLSNLGNKFHDVLQLTRLLTVFSVFDTEAAAIKSFATNSIGTTA